MDILYKSKNFIVTNKPVGVPSQKDLSGDADAMSIVSLMLAEIGEPSELFLVHRLDRVVGGTLAFARNKKAASALSALVSGEGFEKEYFAITEGKAAGGTMKDYIFKDSAKSKAFVTDRARSGVKYAELSYEPIASNDKHTLVKIKLVTGRFHQIRVQFASRRLPLVGDGKYGSRDNSAHTPSLFACRLTFKCLGEAINVTALPDKSQYPWSEFEEEIK